MSALEEGEKTLDTRYKPMYKQVAEKQEDWPNWKVLGNKLYPDIQPRFFFRPHSTQVAQATAGEVSAGSVRCKPPRLIFVSFQSYNA